MTAWLYDQIKSAGSEVQPYFSLQSTLNWAHSLRFEIEEEHGTTPKEQYVACRKHLAGSNRPRNALPCNEVFEPLFSAVNFAVSAYDLAQKAKKAAWLLPTAVINWYYAIYMSSRSMFASKGQKVSDTHSAACIFYASNLARHMPHPYNMLAQHSANEEYTYELPSAPTATLYDLSKAFSPNRPDAQGMLLQYLKGTCQYYVDQTKEKILGEGRFSNFRTKEARKERDSRVRKKISFLHCAYRYRGKANYRDGIYLTYGSHAPIDETEYCNSLAVSARFTTLYAMAVAEHCRGKTESTAFTADLTSNIKGIAGASSNLRFWESI